MDDEELARIEAILRALLIDADLAWALEDIDQAISDGVVTPKRLDQKGRSAAAFGEMAARTRKDELFLTSRPMTSQERVLTYLEAVSTLATAIPEAAGSALRRLNNLESPLEEGSFVSIRPLETFAEEPGFAPSVERLSFLPEAAAVGDAVVTIDDESAERSIEAGAVIQRLLMQIAREVRA